MIDQETKALLVIVTVLMLFAVLLRVLDYYLNREKDRLLKINAQLQEQMTLKGLTKQLYDRANQAKSPMFLMVYDKATDKMIFTVTGNENEFMKKLAEVSQKSEELDEFLQIIAMYYTTSKENQHPSTNN